MVGQKLVCHHVHIFGNLGKIADREIISYSLSRNVVRGSVGSADFSIFSYQTMAVRNTGVQANIFAIEKLFQTCDKLSTLGGRNFTCAVVDQYFILKIGVVVKGNKIQSCSNVLFP